MRLEMTAVSLYFLIQVLGCQLGSAQIKDIHPQSVLSSHQWHALVLLLSCYPTPPDTHLSSVWRFSIMRSWWVFLLFFSVLVDQPKTFCLSVLIACLLSDSDLFSTVRANTVPPVTLADRPKVKTKKILLLQMGKGISLKLKLTENSLQFYRKVQYK